MAHFCIAVLLPPDTSNIEKAIAHRLAPYYQWKVVPHEVTCWCVSRDAMKHGADVAYAQFGTHQTLVDAFWRLPADERFSDDYWATFNHVQLEAARAHPNWGQADSTCENCHGSGIESSSHNDLGEWDRWEIQEDPGVVPVRDLPPEYLDVVAIVTPNGHWHEPRAETRAAAATWHADARELFRIHADMLAAIVNCHG